MKIKFLGTGPGVQKTGRHFQSMIIETKCGNAYLVDAGAPVLDILMKEKYDLSKIKEVFITHLHGDHMGGLMGMLFLPKSYGMKYNIYLSEQRGIDAVEQYLSMIHWSVNNGQTDRVSFRLINEGEFYDDGNVKITAVHTSHMESSSDIAYGFLIEADGESVYITGDLHPTLKDFPEFLYQKQIDMLVTECSHFTVSELMEKVKKCKVRKVAIVHVNAIEKYEELKKMQEEFDFEMLLPNDGDVFSA